jgi:hypothetical protein
MVPGFLRYFDGLSLDAPMNWLVFGCRNDESAF